MLKSLVIIILAFSLFWRLFWRHNFWPLDALLRTGLKENELAVIDLIDYWGFNLVNLDCGPIIDVIFGLYVQLAADISYNLVGYGCLNRPEWTTCWLNTETYPYRRPQSSCFGVKRLYRISTFHQKEFCLERRFIVHHIASCHGNHTSSFTK